MPPGQIGNRSMRICYVADGTSIHTQRWVNYFAGKGHEVHLICWKLMPGYATGSNSLWLAVNQAGGFHKALLASPLVFASYI
jgi:hypothetical protein